MEVIVMAVFYCCLLGMLSIGFVAACLADLWAHYFG